MISVLSGASVSSKLSQEINPTCESGGREDISVADEIEISVSACAHVADRFLCGALM